MFHRVYLLILCCFPLFVGAQNLDSLRAVGQNSNNLEDRLSAYRKLTAFYRHKIQDSSMHYAVKQLAVAKELKDPKGLGIAYGNMGKAYTLANQRDTALMLYEKAYGFLEQAGDLDNQADVQIDWGSGYMMLGNLTAAKPHLRKGIELAKKAKNLAKEDLGLYQMGQLLIAEVAYDSAEIYLLKSKALNLKTGDAYGVSGCWFSLGVLYLYQSKLDQSLNAFVKARNLADSLEYLDDSAINNLNIANVFGMTGNHALALEHAQKALKAAEKLQDESLMGLSYTSMAQTYTNLRQPKPAVEHGKKALLIQQEQMSPRDLSLTYYTLAEASFLNKEIQAGTAYLDSSKQIALEIGATDRLYEADLLWGSYWLETKDDPQASLNVLNQIKKSYPSETPGFELYNHLERQLRSKALFRIGKWEEARRLINESLNDSSLQLLPNIASQTWLLSSVIHAGEGKTKTALEHLNKYELLRDSVFQGQALHGVNILETQFRLKIKNDSLSLMAQKEEIDQQTIARQELSQQKWQALSMGASIAGFSLLLLAVIFYRSRQRARKDRAHIETLHNELDHRVQNNLNFLNSMVAMQSAKERTQEAKAALNATHIRIRALMELHQLLRQEEGSLRVSLTNYLPRLIGNIKEVADFAEYDVQIEQRIEPISIEGSQAFAVALILNEWLTNAFKYAVPFANEPHILVDLKSVGNDQIVVVFADNGPGYDPSQRREGSYGMDLVNSQVRQLRGHLVEQNREGIRYTLTFQTRTSQ